MLRHVCVTTMLGHLRETYVGRSVVSLVLYLIRVVRSFKGVRGKVSYRRGMGVLQ